MSYVDAPRDSALLVILGAGASFDAVSDLSLDRRPPLTNGLVSDSNLTRAVLQKYPRATPVYDYLNREIKGSSWGDKAQSLEGSLRRYQSLAHANPLVTSHMSAFRFYLRDLLFDASKNVVQQRSRVTNFVTLARECVQWSRETGRIVCFVSFNYDPLLEWGLQQVDRFEPLNLADYVAGPNYYVVKPHGSILWNWPDTSQEFGYDIQALSHAIEDGDPDNLPNPPIITSATSTNLVSVGAAKRYSYYPAIALPYDTGKNFVWPKEQDDLFADPKLLTTETTFSSGIFGRVLSIGWRGSEPHFLERLRRLLAPSADFWTVTQGDRSHDEVVDALKSLSPYAGVVYREGGFSTFLDDKALPTVFDWSP